MIKKRAIAIITDSTCDIPEPLVAQYGLRIIPQIIIWGEEQYRDRVDLQPIEFYHRQVSDPQRPTTSQATVTDFKKAYEEAADQGAAEIVVITVSSALSGTYQAASKASEMVKIPVSVIDGKAPSMSLGWQVLAAARARDAGADVSRILIMLDELKNKLVQFVCMDTLEYLQKGGRVGGAIKWVGNLLQVKPLISINHHTGLVEPVGLLRTHKAVVETMYNKFFDCLKGGRNLHVAVLHGNIKEEAEALAERIRSEFNPMELILNITGPVLGINTGPGALALAGYAEG